MKRLLLTTFLTFTICLAYCKSPAKAAYPVDTLAYEFYGTIASLDSGVLTIRRTFGDFLPDAGTEGTLSKSFELKMFNEMTNGWVEMGQCIVKYARKDTIVFDVKNMLSDPDTGSNKNENFKPFSEIKFTWAGSIPRDDLAYKTGMSYYNKDNDIAMQYFQRTLKLNPEYHKALNMLGVIKQSKNDFDSAISYFEQALALDGRNVTYLKNIAMAWFAQGKYRESHEYACKAIFADSTDAQAHFLKGMTQYYLLKVTSTDETKQLVTYELDIALNLDPNNNYFYSQRAYIRNEFGDREGACEDAKKVEILGGNDAEMLVNAYCTNHKKEKQ
jgi:Tfp pilus assembly protein PilF